jgi:hypothetical protein
LIRFIPAICENSSPTWSAPQYCAGHNDFYDLRVVPAARKAEASDSKSAGANAANPQHWTTADVQSFCEDRRSAKLALVA